jgi:ketosteroid isomerase-like protein
VDPENAELVRSLIERFNSGDREIREEEIDPEGEVHSALTGDVYRGHEGLRAWMREIDDQFDTWRLSVDELTDLSDGRILGLGRIHAKGRGSGIELDTEVAWIFEFRDHRLLRMATYFSREAAIDAAGASSGAS